MSQQVYIGNVSQGLTTNREPFVIDNDAFPYLLNFYTFRGRLKRKRGTHPLSRLQVKVITGTSSGIVTLIDGTTTYPLFSNIHAVGGALIASSQKGANITPMTLAMHITGGQDLLDNGDGTMTLSGVGSITAATINYATGVLTLTANAPSMPTSTITAMSYYPGLPVMGLVDYMPYNVTASQKISFPYPLSMGFDQDYSYLNFHSDQLSNFQYFNVNYFKNVPSNTYTDGTDANTTKTIQTPFVWLGEDYQQFWTTNFNGALWATNGNPGMQMQAINGALTINSVTNITIPVLNSPAEMGDFVYVNEIQDTGTPSLAYTINGQTGYVISVVAGVSITVVFPKASISATTALQGGVIQYLTNIVPTRGSGPATTDSGDGVRWFDGDPTLHNGLPSASPFGWVNFAPVLSPGPNTIGDYQSLTPYYLVGCNMIEYFKGRMMFFACYISTSANWLAGEAPIFVSDVVIWSWAKFTFHTASFQFPVGQSIINDKVIMFPMITPESGQPGLTAQGANAAAYYTDTTTYGSWEGAGNQITCVGANEDVLLVSLSSRQARLISTGNNNNPFKFYNINSELGTSATFSGIVFDRGLFSIGTYGFAIVTQQSAQRADLQIPDSAFNIYTDNYGIQRINSVRNFENEWVYFSYVPDEQPDTSRFPTKSFMYNYRDNAWAIIYENYTSQGTFWIYTSNIRAPGIAAYSPNIIAGTPQGFIVYKDEKGTTEAPSCYISGIQDFAGNTRITSYNHCVSVGDYIYISDCVGYTNANGLVGKATSAIDFDNFVLDIPWTAGGTYIGLGKLTKLSKPTMQSKQFGSFFEAGRKTRIGAQQYMFDATQYGQVTLDLFLSTDASIVYNAGPIVPYPGSTNNTLIYTQLVKTSPDTYNTYKNNASLGVIGNGILVSFTFDYFALFTISSPLVQGSVNINVGNVATFTDNGIGGFTATLTGTSAGSSINYTTGMVTIAFTTAPNMQQAWTSFSYTTAGVQNIQTPTAASQSKIWHRMNTSLIGDTVQFGITLSEAQMKDPVIAQSDIVLQAAVINISPSQLLS